MNAGQKEDFMVNVQSVGECRVRHHVLGLGAWCMGYCCLRDIFWEAPICTSIIMANPTYTLIWAHMSTFNTPRPLVLLLMF